MNKMLKFELDKLSKQKSFYFCTIITIVLILISALSANALSTGDSELVMSGWKFASQMLTSAQFVLIFSIFTALFVCEDFDQSTAKNIISKGYGRDTVFIGKYFSSLTSLLVMFVVDIVVAFFLGSIIWGAGEIDSYFRVILVQLVVLLAYHALFFAIAIVLGKKGSAIAVCIVGPMMVGIVLALVDTFIKQDSFKVIDYWIDSFMTTASDVTASTGRIIVSIILSLIYTGVFLAAGFALNRKKQF